MILALVLAASIVATAPSKVAIIIAPDRSVTILADGKPISCKHLNEVMRGSKLSKPFDCKWLKTKLDQ